ncbi:MAG: thiaminase II [Cyclobacteriaceae bacterium]
MNWSEQVWQQINPLYQKIQNLPFNQELMNGNLPTDKFKFYLAQDAYYLLEFGKTLASISGRMSDPGEVLAFSEFASGAIVVERQLHESYFEELGLPHHIKPSPTCLLYTNYIRNQAAFEDLAIAVAAVLPCFWIYKKVGAYIYENQKEALTNPYKKWIDTYAGAEFGEIVNRALSIANQMAATAGKLQRENMSSVFIMATKLEWMFWESAYRKEEWQV